ncbi:MAG: YhdP family protein [Gallionella sp.]
MLNFLPIRLLWHSLNWLSRLAIAASAVLAVLVAISIILLRYWLLPDIEQYHDQIVDSLTTATGVPAITIGEISAEWRGFHPHLKLVDVNILNREHKPALEFKNIDASISWLSLLTAEFRLAALEIDNPELLIRRDHQGNFFVGDLALSNEGGDNAMDDWLLHQSRIVVRDALIVWVDEQRNAPPLVLREVNFRLENMFNYHRFALHALPPEELAAPIDVRGNLVGNSFDDPEGWRGQIFTQLDYTDVTAWLPWLDLPESFRHGRGAIRGWLGIEEGMLSELIADVDLRDVIARLSDDVPEMVLLDVHGRTIWRVAPGGVEIATEALSMRLQNGLVLQPMDFYFLNQRSDEQVSGQIYINLLRLEQIASLTEYIPLEGNLREKLAKFSPSGKVSNLKAEWVGALESPDTFKIRGQLDDITIHQVGNFPGVSRLTADIDGDEKRGRINISSRHLKIDVPDVMREPLFFSIVTGQAGWKHEHGELRINVDNLTLANDDLAGNVYGSYQTRQGTLGELDLTGRLTRGEISSAARYTPLIALNMEGNEWLNNALLAGQTNDFRIRIKGNLSDFPIQSENSDVLFKIGAHVRGGVLEFDKEWPRIENIDGEFLISGNRLEINPADGTMDGVRLKNVVVAIPDMTSSDLALEINGDAVADNKTFLHFVQHSPVRGYISGFTDGVSATGNSHLALYMKLPLEGDLPLKVAGNLNMTASDIDMGEGVPWLRNTKGVLTFTESGMQTRGVTANILGDKAIINVQTIGSDTVHATIQGRSNISVLRKRQKHPLLSYLNGKTTWDADIRVVNNKPKVVIRSNLLGIKSTLPAPFSKTSNEKMTLHLEKTSTEHGQDLIVAKIGSLVNVRLARAQEGKKMTIKRGIVSFGSQAIPENISEHDGVWFTGSLPEFSLLEWGGVLDGVSNTEGGLPIAGGNLKIGKVSGFGVDIDDLNVEAEKRGEGLGVQLTSNNLNGEVDWQPYDEGKLSVKLKNFSWGGIGAMADEAGESTPMSPGSLPSLQVSIENMVMKGQSIGRVDLVGHPEGQDWKLRRLNLTNSDGSLSGNGIWKSDKGKMQTELNLQLSLVDAGKTLARSGYPDTVKGGSGKLSANLSWAGPPSKYSNENLNGTLTLDAGKGRFLQMEPGAGKLLSILSLQALPKRISLDFTDVFSAGFQFDSIKGTANINQGVIDTRGFSINGSSAKVILNGSVDLKNETQNIRAKVLPTLGDTVSLIGAFVISPVVGLGTLIVNEVLGNPLDNLVSFEYNIDGTWSDPNVTKINRNKPNNFLNEQD